MSISGSGFDFQKSILNAQQRDIESTTTQVEDQYISLSLDIFVQTVGNGCCSGLVDDSQYIQSGNDSGILGGLSLRVVEVGWYCNNSIFDSHSQIVFGSFFHFSQNHRRNLFWMKLLSFSLKVDLNHWFVIFSSNDGKWPQLHILLDFIVIEFSSDESLGVENSVFWVSGDLVLGRVSDQSLCVGKCDVRRSSSFSLVVGDDLHFLVQIDSYAGVGGS